MNIGEESAISVTERKKKKKKEYFIFSPKYKIYYINVF